MQSYISTFQLKSARMRVQGTHRGRCVILSHKRTPSLQHIVTIIFHVNDIISVGLVLLFKTEHMTVSDAGRGKRSSCELGQKLAEGPAKFERHLVLRSLSWRQTNLLRARQVIPNAPAGRRAAQNLILCHERRPVSGRRSRDSPVMVFGFVSLGSKDNPGRTVPIMKLGPSSRIGLVQRRINTRHIVPKFIQTALKWISIQRVGDFLTIIVLGNVSKLNGPLHRHMQLSITNLAVKHSNSVGTVLGVPVIDVISASDLGLQFNRK
ncbi:MAG: hypothetical protein [Cressdnaviricota sp.]|nr:MAG: hypothetical protein [Cressdnaviricota sp.]